MTTRPAPLAPLTPARATVALVAVCAIGLSGCVTTVVGAGVGLGVAAVKTTGKVAVGTVKVTGKAVGAVIPDGDDRDDQDD